MSNLDQMWTKMTHLSRGEDHGSRGISKGENTILHQKIFFLHQTGPDGFSRFCTKISHQIDFNLHQMFFQNNYYFAPKLHSETPESH